MRPLIRFVMLVCPLALASLTLAPTVRAQDKSPGEAIVSMYQVSAGKHLEFLKWMAKREAITKEAGGPATMWYVHTNGDGWDYVGITPQLDGAKQAGLDKKVDEISKAKGLTIGMKASLEFRQFIAKHSDTFAMGPMTADEIVKMAEK
jgi:hypothetical protein